MKVAVAVLAIVAAIVVGMYVRATSPSDAPLVVGPTTTVISGPHSPQGGVDFDAAMGASPASERRLQALLEALEQEPEAQADCAPLADVPRARIVAILREPLRLTRPASHITEASQQLAPRLLLLLRRLACSCSKQPATAAAEAQLLASLAAYLSSSNHDTFYQLHALAAHAATACFRAAPTAAPEAGLHFFDAIEHLELVRLGMLEEIVGRHDPMFDANAALVAFNEDFMRALDGAELPTPMEPEFSWLRSADANRQAKSAFVGRSYAQQLPEIVAATRTAHQNAVNERRAWAGE